MPARLVLRMSVKAGKFLCLMNHNDPLFKIPRTGGK
jgi:hypothetical protein